LAAKMISNKRKESHLIESTCSNEFNS